MDYRATLGINPDSGENEVGRNALFEYVNMRLSAAGQPVFGSESDYPVLELAKPLLENYREFSKLSSKIYCPPDLRIMRFITSFLEDVMDEREPVPELPHKTFVLDHFGTARTLSLPPDSDMYQNAYVQSYRVRQGVLNNPQNDRRTTAGVFHVVEGGLPVPDDKKSVPKIVFKNMWKKAFEADDALLELPFTSTQKDKAKTWVSLLLRPIVCPAVPNLSKAKKMEIRFFAPGGLVSNPRLRRKYFRQRRQSVPRKERLVPPVRLVDGQHGLHSARPAPDETHGEGIGTSEYRRRHRPPEARRNVLERRKRAL